MSERSRGSVNISRGVVAARPTDHPCERPTDRTACHRCIHSNTRGHSRIPGEEAASFWPLPVAPFPTSAAAPRQAEEEADEAWAPSISLACLWGPPRAKGKCPGRPLVDDGSTAPLLPCALPPPPLWLLLRRRAAGRAYKEH